MYRKQYAAPDCDTSDSDLVDIFFVYLDSRSKVKFQGQTGNQVNMVSYLKTYLTQRLHTRYHDTT